MLIRTGAIVLHKIKYKETGFIVYLYTREAGRLSCIINSLKPGATKFQPAHFQPLTILDVMVYFKPERGLQRIKELSCSLNYISLPFNNKKSCVAMFLAEILYKTLREEEANKSLFDFIFDSFKLFDDSLESMNNFHLSFLLHYSKFLGFSPSGLFIPGKANDNNFFSDLPEGLMKKVIELSALSISESPRIHLKGAERSLILDSIIQYFNQNMEYNLNIKSLAVMKEMFYN